MKTVATFMSAEEAHLLRIRLEDEGISATVPDETTTGVAPHYINAIGGVRVQVSAGDFPAARAIASRDLPNAGPREDIVCPACGASDIAQPLDRKPSYILSFLILVLTMLPVPVVKLRYRCNGCGHLWKRKR